MTITQARPTNNINDVIYDSHFKDAKNDTHYQRVSAVLDLSGNGILDKFGRIRVSNPVLIFDATFNQGINTIAFDTSTANGGTVTHNSNRKSAVLTATTTTNSTSILQSRQYLKYVPAVSPLIFQTGNFMGAATSVIKRIGQYDESNGYFWELSGSTLSVVIRSSITGSIVDTNRAAQANWNKDTMDGTGGTSNPSGITFNTSNQQIFYTNYQWLGSGIVEFGLCINGILYPCHQFYHSNLITTMYSQSATLPLRYEIKNTGSTSSTMEVTCMSMLNEGVVHSTGIPRAGGTGVASRALAGAGANFPLISIRKKTAAAYVPIIINDIIIFLSTNDQVLVELIHNPTLTGATFAVNPGSGICEIDIAAASFTGGTVIHQDYLSGGSSQGHMEISDMFLNTYLRTLGCAIGGTTSDIITVSVSNISTGSTLRGAFNYVELVN